MLLFPFRPALELLERAQRRGQHPGLADEGGDEDRIQDLVLARPRARRGSHVQLQALVRAGGGGGSDG